MRLINYILLICSLCVGLIAHGQVIVNDQLECSWLDYELGNIAIGESASCRLTIKNISTSNLEIKHLITSCSCVTASAKERIIKPGLSIDIDILYKSSYRKSGESYQQIILYMKDESVYAFGIHATLEYTIDTDV